uniref:Si:ch211-161h7.5 n=1 Tax=Amphilophus citrinellus TaxID=61819 RepID=A0A3Q0T5E6_AMPCI
MVFSALAALGKPFLLNTRNISDEFVTQITPSRWTFSVWSIIYVFMGVGLLFVFAGIFRNAYGYVYCSPAILPHGFFVTLCINLGINIGWLLLWDRLMIPALVFLILIICTNYSMICFICHGIHVYGAWLNKYHKTDLRLLRVLQVQNGVMIYTTWTTVATLLNLTIVLAYEAQMSQEDAATVFALENFVLDKHVRYICIIYPVVIWAMSGNLDKNYDAVSPSRNGIFIVLLAVACVLFVIRLILVVWRHI